MWVIQVPSVLALVFLILQLEYSIFFGRLVKQADRKILEDRVRDYVEAKRGRQYIHKDWT